MTPIKQPTVTVDTQGLICPEPVMMLHQAIRKSSSGECIVVLATDPSTERDIPKFCQHLGHQLIKHQSVENDIGNEIFEYWVVKK